jgi:hypothetical protein
MATETYPLTLPEDLLQEVREVASQKHLSLEEAVSQSVRLGLPKLAEKKLSDTPPAELKPFSQEECLQAWGPDTDGDESDRIAAAMGKVVLPRE